MGEGNLFAKEFVSPQPLSFKNFPYLPLTLVVYDCRRGDNNPVKFPIEEIWIDEDAAGEPLVERIVLPATDATIRRGDDAIRARKELLLSADPFKAGKRIVRLMSHKGRFVKPCPGTNEYLCCGLQILHIGQGCPMDCRYCALQAYFNRPWMEVFVNIDEMLGRLNDFLDNSDRPFTRLCTGEFTDSLALDPLTGLSAGLVESIAHRTDACLEIKTKTDTIESLLDVDPRGRVVLSFSMNAASISRNDELRAASLDRRLNAARTAERHGYRLGFHFDPIIPFPGWQAEYQATVDRIFADIDPASIAWISLGVIRFVPDLKEIARMRFGPIRYYHDEFVRGLDGKSRLPAGRRIEVYRRMVDFIRRHDPRARVYFCMESPRVWHEVLDMNVTSDDDVIAYLDEAMMETAP